MQKNIDGRCIYKPSENRASLIKAAYEKELFLRNIRFTKNIRKIPQNKF